MANIRTPFSVELALEKREFTLITKALVGKLRPEEVEEAKALGLMLQAGFAKELSDKAQHAAHALDKAGE